MNISEIFWKNFEKQTKNELRRRIFPTLPSLGT